MLFRSVNDDTNRKRKVDDKDAFIIVTININIMGKEKVKNVVDNITKSMIEQGHDGGDRPDIMFIQETKIGNINTRNTIIKEMASYGYEMHHNPVLSITFDYKHGNCVLIKKGSKLLTNGRFESFDWDIEGRICIWNCLYGIFIGIHAATHNTKPSNTRKYIHSDIVIQKRFIHREIFDRNIRKYIEEKRKTRTVITLGDFNMSSQSIDSSAGLWDSPAYNSCRSRHNDLKSSCHLVDIWRSRNVIEEERYTSWINHLDEPSQARIDLILIPSYLDNEVQYIEIMDNVNFCYDGKKKLRYGLDHVPVVMKITLLPDIPYNRNEASNNKRVAR